MDVLEKLVEGVDNLEAERVSRAPFITLVIDVFLFGLLGIIAGIIVNLFIPRPTLDESIKKTIVLLFVQLIVAAVVITLVVKVTPMILPREADEFGGMTVFGLLFFAAQGQLRFRITKLTQYIMIRMGRKPISQKVKEKIPTEISSEEEIE